MSETEGQQVTTQETGRCEKAAHEVTHASWNHRFHESVFQIATAATIDRLAADVASIKAKVDALSPDDVRHFVDSEKAWVAMIEQQRDAAIRDRNEARVEVERLKAELEQQPIAAPPPAAPPAVWLKDGERAQLWFTLDVLRRLSHFLAAEAVEAILARAGFPPVVVLPTVFQRSSLCDEFVALQQVKDSLDKAGVKWKEVRRE